jgi:hypothetical protein
MSEASAPVAELIRLREQLTDWIAKLDEVGTEASTRVTERVRADYLDRLRRVDEDLTAHASEIEAELDRFRGSLVEAEARRSAAGEALEEGRLRHLIGELDDAAWEDARVELERELADADATVGRASGEVERLSRLSAEIAGGPPAPAEPFEAVWTPEEPGEPAPAAAAPGQAPGADEPVELEEVAAEPPPQPPAEPAQEEPSGAETWDPFGGEFGGEAKQQDVKDDLPWLAGMEDPTAWPAPPGGGSMEFLQELDETAPAPAEPSQPPPERAQAEGGDLGADDLAFLEELDRTIGSASARPPKEAATPRPAPITEETPSPAPGGKGEPLLCKECGAINEPHSWYCEICGSEL